MKLFFILIVIFSFAFGNIRSDALQSSTSWQSFEQLSSPAPYISEPKIATDVAGNLHVFWTQRDESGYGVIYYTRYTDGQWTPPVDVLFSPEREVAWLMDVEVAPDGYLHVLFVSNNHILYHSNVPITQATVVRAWREPKPLAFDTAYSGWGADMLVDQQGHLHLVYCDGFSPNLFYMRSETGGASWTDPQAVYGLASLSDFSEGATSTMLAIDEMGQLHAVWTTRVLPNGWPGVRAFYARSLDLGNTWQNVLLVDTIENTLYDENRGPFFLSLGLGLNDEVHLAWAGAPNGDRWHQWSVDGGQNWTNRQMILGKSRERYGTTGFLAMIKAPNDVLHLFTTFQASHGGLMESIWNGTQWTSPKALPYGDLNCEDPRAVITFGNELHLVCVNQKGGTPGIFHSRKILDTPRVSPHPLATSSRIITPITGGDFSPQEKTTPKPYGTPHLVPNSTTLSSLSISQIILLSVIPAALMVIVVLAFQLRHRRYRG